MNKSKHTGINILKGLAIGCALVSAVTMVVATNKKSSKKLKSVTHNLSDNISNMLTFK